MITFILCNIREYSFNHFMVVTYNLSVSVFCLLGGQRLNLTYTCPNYVARRNRLQAVVASRCTPPFAEHKSSCLRMLAVTYVSVIKVYLSTVRGWLTRTNLLTLNENRHPFHMDMLDRRIKYPSTV
jgi:hypothetical protein